MIYQSGNWKDEYEHDITKLKQVICNHICSHLKFVKGEGTKSWAKKNIETKNPSQLLLQRPNLTQLTGYKYQILRLVEISEINTTILAQALWWKTYTTYVHQEIRQRINVSMKIMLQSQ